MASAQVLSANRSLTASASFVDMQIEYPSTTQAQTASTVIDYSADEQMDYEMTEIAKIRMEDTHLLASSLDVDVEMNQVEIDTNTLKLILVLDTNIFISNLSELELLAFRNQESVLLSVPWVVLQELDGLKSNRLIAEKSQKAIRFIHEILSRKTLHNFIFESSIQVNI